MNENINNWLAQRANLPVCLAAGVVYPDGTAFTNFYSRSFSAVLKEEVWPALADMARGLEDQQLPAVHLRWLFQNAFVYGSLRADGLCALIITSRNLSAEDAAVLDGTLSEFQTV